MTPPPHGTQALLGRKDPELGSTLTKLRVSPTFYGFRWITLLMTQEFDLPDVMRLWDSLLADGAPTHTSPHMRT